MRCAGLGQGGAGAGARHGILRLDPVLCTPALYNGPLRDDVLAGLSMLLVELFMSTFHRASHV